MIIKRDAKFFAIVFVLLIVFTFILSLSFFVSAVDDLMSLQGNVKQNSLNLASGNLTVVIFDAYSSGNIIYNSTSEFNNAVNDGKYDVLLGNGTNQLSLKYGKFYFIEMYVNNEKFSFNGSTRQIFQSSVGNISISELISNENIVFRNDSVNFSSGQNVSTGIGGWFKGLFNLVIGSDSGIYLNFNGSTLSFNETKLNNTYRLRSDTINQNNVSDFFNNLVTSLIGNNTYANISWNYNQTAPANTYTDSRGFITSLIGNNTYTKIGSANQTTLDITNITNFLYNYNQTIASNIFNQHLNTTSAVAFDSLNVTGILRVGTSTLTADSSGSLNITANTNFNGGWTSGGVSIINGNVFAQTVYVYNITSLAVANLDINGSLLPIDMNNTFDVGNNSHQWRNGYFATDVYVGGNAVKVWLYNQTAPANTYTDSRGFVTSLIGNGTYLRNDSSANLTSLLISSSLTINSSLGSGIFIVRNSSNNLLFVNGSSGFVGIGTLTPTQLLDVRGNINVSNEVYVKNGTALGVWAYNQTAPALIISNASISLITNNSFSSVSNSTYIKLGNAITNDSNANLTDLNVTGRFSANRTLFVTILGLIGINTATPTYMLDVRGNSSINQTLYVNTNGLVGIGTLIPTQKLEVAGIFNITNSSGGAHLATRYIGGAKEFWNSTDSTLTICASC